VAGDSSQTRVAAGTGQTDSTPFSGSRMTPLANDEMVFHYQPQVDLETGDLVGAEALVRWNHGAFGLQPPQRFLRVARKPAHC